MSEIKSHPFFRGVRWATLLTDPAPFVPEARPFAHIAASRLILFDFVRF